MAEYTGKKMLVGGNWKSNGTVASVKELCALLNTLAVPSNVEVCASDTEDGSSRELIAISAQSLTLCGIIYYLNDKWGLLRII